MMDFAFAPYLIAGQSEALTALCFPEAHRVSIHSPILQESLDETVGASAGTFQYES